jgi:hypothetical protein
MGGCASGKTSKSDGARQRISVSLLTWIRGNAMAGEELTLENHWDYPLVI